MSSYFPSMELFKSVRRGNLYQVIQDNTQRCHQCCWVPKSSHGSWNGHKMVKQEIEKINQGVAARSLLGRPLPGWRLLNLIKACGHPPWITCATGLRRLRCWFLCALRCWECLRSGVRLDGFFNKLIWTQKKEKRGKKEKKNKKRKSWDFYPRGERIIRYSNIIRIVEAEY